MYIEIAQIHRYLRDAFLRQNVRTVDMPIEGSKYLLYTYSCIGNELLSSLPRRPHCAIAKYQSMPTYLNQLGLQSSLNRNLSPSVKRPVTHPLHLGDLGQLK